MPVGFQAFNAGVLACDFTDRLPRFVHSQSFAFDYSGTVSIPAFDDTKGLFAVYPKIVKTGVYPYPRVADDFAENVSYHQTNPLAMPTLNWNNTTKILTVTASTISDGFNLVPDWNIIFFHHS